MFSRIGYALRETWQGFQRNWTLTLASVLTAAVSLLLAGMSFFIQKAFDQVLHEWSNNVQFVVFMKPDATTDQIAAVKATLDQQTASGVVRQAPYVDKAATFVEFNSLFSTNQTIRDTLKLDDMPTQFKVSPASEDSAVIGNLILQFQNRPGVEAVKSPEEYVKVISKLSGFIRWVTTGLWIVLLGTAVGLIWNTIRTAMFARRREIEVMKLVGATNWFIRVPFMLEGLIQGLIGSAVASFSLLGINVIWSGRIRSVTSGVGNVKELALVHFIVGGGYVGSVMLRLIILGALAGAVGAGIAASRFLDV
jgi:cell division transport system permease protein